MEPVNNNIFNLLFSQQTSASNTGINNFFGSSGAQTQELNIKEEAPQEQSQSGKEDTVKDFNTTMQKADQDSQHKEIKEVETKETDDAQEVEVKEIKAVKKAVREVIKSKVKQSLKEELEVTNEAIEAIASQIIAAIQNNEELEINIDLEALVEEIDPAVLQNMMLKVSDKIEDLTKLITELDLESEEGINQILKISESLDIFTEIRDQLVDKLEGLVEIKDLIKEEIPELKEEVRVLVETKIQELVTEIKTIKEGLELKDKLDIAHIKTSIQSLNAELKHEEAKLKEIDVDKLLDEDIIDTEELKQLLQENKSKKPDSLVERLLNKFDQVEEVQVQKPVEPSTTTKVANSDFLVELLDGTDLDSYGQDTQQGSNQGFEFLTPNSANTKITNVRQTIIREAVPIKELPSFIADKASSAVNNVKQELNLILNPEKLGRIDMQLLREGNSIDIKILVANKEALQTLEQKVAEIKNILKEKGFDTSINVSSTEKGSNEQEGQSQANAQQENEAQEKQKEKILDLIPEWLYQDEDAEDFDAALSQVE